MHTISNPHRTTTAPIIDVDGVTVRFGEHTALDRISFSIGEGGVHGLLGPNGSGKTTLVRVIATLLEADKGTVRVGGHDVGHDPVAVRRMIGLAGQYAAVDDLLTGRENLEIVGRLYGFDRRTVRHRATEVLERLSLGDVGDHLVGTYSGGMRRRLDLGASLVGRPRVVLLDEPTTGLDPRTRLELWEFLRDMVGSGTTVLLTTQYLEEADALADRITVIDHGSVIAEGTADELKESVGRGQVVVVPLDRAALADVAQVLEHSLTAQPHIDEERHAVVVPVDDRIDDLVAAATAVRGAGIELGDIVIERPSLDGVFLAITGRTT